MKIKRFVADSMREAIRLVREEQGPDAVILSNRRTDSGVEIVAAVDYDEAMIRHAARAAETVTPPASSECRPASIPSSFSAAAVPASIPAESSSAIPSIAALIAAAENANQAKAAAAAAAATVAAPARSAEVGDFGKLTQQLSSMRRLLETQLSTLTLGQFRASHSVRAGVMRELARIGFEVPVAREVATEVPDGQDDTQTRIQALKVMERRIPVAKDDLLLAGGVVALIGPTGVGKTTTLAKLAARFAARHGIRQVALICMDHYRIGAQEQLYTYGRRLGVPVYTADDGASLTARLNELGDCKLVLIDTAGLGPRDTRLPAQLAELAQSNRPLSTYLVMAANSPAPDLEQTVKRFGATSLAGSILTKLDESTRLGAALSVLSRHQLPLAYVCDGQRVPEDLRRADAHELIRDAIRMSRSGYLGSDSTLIEEDIDASALAFV